MVLIVIISLHTCHIWVSQVTPVVKDLPASAGDICHVGSIPGSGRSSGERIDNLLQYSCLETPMTEKPGRLQLIGSHRVEHD